MSGKITLWITLVTACVTMEIGVTGAQRILAVSVPGKDGLNWPEIMYFPDVNDQPTPGRIYGEAYYVPATRDDVAFVLYTRRGPASGETLKLGDERMLRRSSFDPLSPTVFVTHGFQSAARARCVQDIKNMYMGFHWVNLITVDWSRIASSINYFVVKRQTIPVGGVVAEFVNFLKLRGGVDLGNIHLVGHSLGAHVMGIAGKAFSSQSRKIGRITGLDPAGPLFKVNDPSTRIDRRDGEFVDIIHTCAGWLGFSAPIGKVDFYPNGGAIGQPGCSWDRVKMGTCSHSRAWQFYAESINSADFTSLPCTSYDDFQKRRNCNTRLKASMGMPAPARIVGKYFLLTASAPPFALGG